MIQYAFDVFMQHVSFVEFIWFIIMLFGVVRYGLNRYLSVVTVRTNYKQEHVSHLDDSTKYQLDVRAFRYLTIATIFWFWLLLGIRAMLQPNPSSVNNDLEQIMLLALLVGGAGLLFLKGEYADILENKAYKKYREELREKIKEEVTEQIADDVHGMMMNCTCGAAKEC